MSRETPQQKADEWKDEGEREGGPLGKGARSQLDNNLTVGTRQATSASAASELFHHCPSIKEVTNPPDEKQL